MLIVLISFIMGFCFNPMAKSKTIYDNELPQICCLAGWDMGLRLRLECKYYPTVTVEGIGCFKDIHVYSSICIIYVNTI